jgi:putative MATE family efflux protein
MDGAPVKEPMSASSGAAEANGAAAGRAPPLAPGLAPAVGPPSVRRVFALAWPVWVHQLLLLSVILSDSFLAGHFRPGEPSRHVAYQSAQNTAIYLSWFLTSLTMLVTVGSTALVARFVGAGDRRAAVHATNQSIVLAVGFGLAGTVVGLVVLEGAVWLLQLRGDTAEFAVAYLRPLLGLLVFQVIQVAGNACLVGAGDTRTGMFVLGGVAVLNIGLAWLFFHGLGPVPGLGFVGISWGTALSYAVGGLIMLALLARGRAGLRLRWGMLRPDGRLLWRLLRVGVPAAADSLSASLGQLWFLSVINSLGDTAGGAHGVALRWEALAFLSGNAFGTAAMALVGQNLGAGRPADAQRSGWIAFGLGGAVMTAMGVIFYALAPPMFALFCPYPEQRPIIAAGVPVLRLVAFAMPALASCIIFTSALRGAGDTRVPVLFTLTGFFAVRLPLAYFLALNEVDLGPLGVWPGWGLGLIGAWWAMFADLVVRGAFLFYRFAGGRWQQVRV